MSTRSRRTPAAGGDWAVLAAIRHRPGSTAACSLPWSATKWDTTSGCTTRTPGVRQRAHRHRLHLDRVRGQMDVMGGSANHFNAFQKERLGWLNYGSSPPITTVTSSGTYSIDGVRDPGTNPKALKIPIGTTGSNYYVELRRPVGFDAGLSGNTNVMNGVVLHQASPSNGDSSQLLDMTASSSWSDPALLIGQSFTDSTAQITITPVSITATNASVTVSLGTAGCTRSNPSIALSPSQSAGVAAGTPVSFTATVTNNDTPTAARPHSISPTPCLPAGRRPYASTAWGCPREPAARRRCKSLHRQRPPAAPTRSLRRRGTAARRAYVDVGLGDLRRFHGQSARARIRPSRCRRRRAPGGVAAGTLVCLHGLGDQQGQHCLRGVHVRSDPHRAVRLDRDRCPRRRSRCPPAPAARRRCRSRP